MKLLRGVVSLSFCQMTENPSGLAEGEEIKVGSQTFSVLQLVNFVLGTVSLIWLCLHFDLYYRGDQFYKASR